MSNDWRSRNKMTPREGVKAALIIIGLMAGCIFVVWLLAKLLR
jgi:hypothetical protein